MREFRKLLFGLCCSLGGLTGLWWAITTTPPQPQGDHALQQLGAITGPVLIRFGSGFGAGIALGLVFCLIALKPR
jgi:hypothetical protein